MMDLLDGLKTRKTFRGFTDQTVSKEAILEILADGHDAPSASNMQPWHFHVISGQPLEALCSRIRECHQSRKISYNPSKDKKIPDKYMLRRKDLFKALKPYISSLGDENRDFVVGGSLRFYNSPVVIFITTDRDLPDNKLLDIGMAAQNIMLSAHARGLATCAIAYTLLYSDPIMDSLNIGQDKELVLSIALGYPDNSFSVNEFKSGRETIDSLITWIGQW